MSSAASPRRRRKSAAARIRPFWILFVVVLAAAAGFTYWAATWPGLYPKSIDVEGNRLVPSSEIVSRARIDRRKNLWLQNAAAIESRVRAIPYIDRARFYRSFVTSAAIVVTERKPYAVLRSGDIRLLVDRDLRVLEDAPQALALPVFDVKAGLEVVPGSFVGSALAKELRDRNDALTAAHVIPAALAEDKYGDLIVTLHSGVRVLLGDDENLEKKIALIDPILAQTAKKGRRIARLDLRAPNAPVVVFR